MEDLCNLTIIIPIRVESTDRLYNIKAVLGYLNHHFKCKVKIYEVYSNESKLNFLTDYSNLDIQYFYEVLPDTQPFHRTKYLNFMLEQTSTELVSNYDADVLLPVDTYTSVVRYLQENKADFVYPFIFGEGQKKLHYSKWYEDKHKDLLYWSMMKFLETFDLRYLDEEDTFITTSTSTYGHCFFTRTETYKAGFGENEKFISYGPEDIERANRFSKLGYNVKWWNSMVYHLEHIRTQDSSENNPYWILNNELFNYLEGLNKVELLEYYSNMS